MGNPVLDAAEGYNRVLAPADDVVPLFEGSGAFPATRSILVGTPGTLNVVMANGAIRNGVPVQAGMNPLRIKQLLDGGTADDVWGVFASGGSSGGGTSGVNFAQGTHFDGTNDFLNHVGVLTGAANSKLWTGSLWFKSNDNTRNHVLLQGRNVGDNFRRYAVRLQSNGFFVIDGWRTTTARTLNISFAFTDTTSWHHVMWSVDLNDIAGKTHLYLDDVSTLEGNVSANNEIDFGGAGRNSVGASFDSGSKASMDMADIWSFDGIHLDLSITANRRKFISATGKPVDLGLDGSTPTGASPRIFMSGPVADWHTNKGVGGGYTENGVITGAPSPGE